MDTLGPPENNLRTSMEISFMDADMWSQDITSNESAICPSSDIMCDFPALQYDRVGIDDHLHSSYDSQILTINEELKNNIKNGERDFPSESACSSTKMKLNGHMSRIGKSETGVSMSNYLDVEGWNYGYEVNDYMSPVRCSLFDANGCSIDEKVSMQPLASAQSYMCGDGGIKDEKPEEMLAPSRSIWHSFDEAVNRGHSCSADNKMFSRDSNSSLSLSPCSLSAQKTEQVLDLEEDMIVASKKPFNSQNYINSSLVSLKNAGNLSLNAQGQYMPFAQPFTSSNIQPISVGSHLSKVSPESSQSNFSEKSIMEDDSDICIIEDMSHPANTMVTPHHSKINHLGVGGRFRAKDERLILRLLQVWPVSLVFLYLLTVCSPWTLLLTFTLLVLVIKNWTV